MPESNSPTLSPVRVWDLPTRLFHWLLVAAVVGLVITGNVGGNALVWHMRLGLLVLALLGFRLVWGLVGGHWSRFASFLHAPGTVLRYLRGQAAPHEHLDVGHNPLGAFSVLAMLALLIAQVATGLLADDEISTTGPLNRYVATATGLAATSWHKGVGKSLIILLVVLHVAAIVFYRVKRGKDLVGPMLRGDKPLPAGVPAADDSRLARLRALAVAAVWVGIAVAIARLGT
jgi:cytochrome b